MVAQSVYRSQLVPPGHDAKLPVGLSVGSANSLLNTDLILEAVTNGSSPFSSLTALATWRATSAKTIPHDEASFQVSGRLQTTPPFATQHLFRFQIGFHFGWYSEVAYLVFPGPKNGSILPLALEEKAEIF